MKKEKIGGLILKVLTDADTSLQVEEIVECIQNRVDPSAETEELTSWVARELQSDISSCVERDGSSRWSINIGSRSKTDEPSDEQEEGRHDGESTTFRSQFSEAQDNVYRGPGDLDESEFLSVLHGIDPSVQGHVAAEIQQSGDPIKSALDRSEYKLGQKHARRVERGEAGARPEKVVELVRKAAGEIEGPIEDVFVARGDDREGQTGNESGGGRPAETLSFLQKAILGAMDSGEALSIEEIAEALRRKRGRDVPSAEILEHLRNELDGFVSREPPLWSILPSYSGRYSAAEVPAPDSDEPESSKHEDEEHEGNDFDQLSAEILRILYGSSPLEAGEIAKAISETKSILPEEDSQAEGVAGKRLRGELSSFVKKNGEDQWEVEVSSEETRRVTGEPEARHEAVLGGRTSEDTSEGGLDEVQSTTEGLFGEINGRLKLADRIVFVLDLLSGATTTARLTSILNSRGLDVTREGVRCCLKSTLSRFVQKTEDGYRLRRENQKEEGRYHEEFASRSGVSSQHPSDESAGQPIDQATRASTSSRSYGHVFSGEALETSSLFASQVRGGTVEIQLNSSHPAFEKVQYMIEEKTEVGDAISADQYRELLRTLITAWFEVEGDLTGKRGELAEEMRSDWGQVLDSLLR
ncbi:hypothetical protein GGQ03_000603 [Salinibacter ruber]|uniref:hypothetical protein n=1 Tax=Salinibacter ruber TaxID=146919 RepID=UPI00216774DF|nr:hypothetical protein [Salinibacter ruber]MCS4153346.1 hypothetical protein [Salinibacter ruber]